MRFLPSNLARRRVQQIAGLAAAATLCRAGVAEAAYYEWPYQSPSFYRPDLADQVRRPAPRHRSKRAKQELPARDIAVKPKGALIIAVSINTQRVKIYDADGMFAEAPVSTGMRGHPTPMGVFSVIQKHKWHQSNIYSGAPMPYMQRITWSGIALHAGVLPGYPASHGCIRLPPAFATKMWNWTRIGARVLVTPDDVSPAPFAHPWLPSAKVKSDITADAARDATFGKPAEAAIQPEGQDKMRTADAGGEPLGKSASIIPTSERPKDGATTALADQPAEAKAQRDAADSAAPTDLSLRSGPVAVFISGKDSRLYVRQNLAPVFDLPIRIAASDRPLGTHVFTAQIDQSDANVVHWSSVSLPASARTHRADGRPVRGSRGPADFEAKIEPAVDSPAEALERIGIPSEVMSKIAGALTTGSSIIVSDQGIRQGETGEDTDFVILLR